MSRHWSLSTVTTNFPPQRSCSRSRYRVGITIRPFASRVKLLEPRNIVGWVAQPIPSHFFPPASTIGSGASHCQRVKLKKTWGNSDLGHSSATVTRLETRPVSNQPVSGYSCTRRQECAVHVCSKVSGAAQSRRCCH